MFIPNTDLPKGAQIFAWSRTIRWIGWGFGEALLPIFIIGFSNTFAEAGLLSSSVDIASLISLPLIGAWADRVPAKYLVLVSLLLYPMVGLSYFLAGMFGLAIFIVVARVLNGFTWELENVGIQTYYRRAVSSVKIGESFGFIETWSHVSWIVAAAIGRGLAVFVPIHWLLFLIAPFAILAYFVAVHAPKDPVRRIRENAETKTRFYRKAFSEFRSWNSRLWLVGLLFAFTSVIGSLMYFFIPIDAYINGANLPMVSLIAILGAIPATFAYSLGKLADRHDKFNLVVVALAMSSLIATGLILFQHYWFKLVAMFLTGIVLELIYVVQSSLITTLGPSETYGERGSAFEGINVLCDLLAPLLIGAALDIVGFNGVSIAIAIVAVVLAVAYGRFSRSFPSLLK